MSLSDKLQQKLQQKKEIPKKTTTKTTTSVKRPSKYELLENKFNTFKNEIDQKLQQILQQKLQPETKILPEEIHNEFKVIALQFARKYAHTKRYWFINKKYSKGLNPSNNEPDKIAYERLIELSKLF